MNWNSINLTDKQVKHIEMLCKFHLATSENQKAKEVTKKLQWCMKNWLKPITPPEDE